MVWLGHDASRLVHGVLLGWCVSRHARTASTAAAAAVATAVKVTWNAACALKAARDARLLGLHAMPQECRRSGALTLGGAFGLCEWLVDCCCTCRWRHCHAVCPLCVLFHLQNPNARPSTSLLCVPCVYFIYPVVPRQGRCLDRSTWQQSVFARPQQQQAGSLWALSCQTAWSQNAIRHLSESETHCGMSGMQLLVL